MTTRKYSGAVDEVWRVGACCCGCGGLNNQLRAKIRSFGGHENGDWEACGAPTELPVVAMLALKVRARGTEVSRVEKGRNC